MGSDDVREIKTTLDALSEVGEMQLDGQIQDIVITVKKSNKEIVVVHSPMLEVDVLGLMEFGKFIVMEAEE